MKAPEQISASQMEMMKFQEVILKAMAGKLKWWEAAEILGITDRQLRRIRERHAEQGYDGRYDYRKRQPSLKRVSVELLQRVLILYANASLEAERWEVSLRILGCVEEGAFRRARLLTTGWALSVGAANDLEGPLDS